MERGKMNDSLVGMRRLTVVLMTTMIGLTGLVGCGETPPTEALGRVEFNGKGVYPATLMFKDPEGNLLPVSTASDGSFRLLGAQPTTYEVAIQTPRLAGVGAARGPIQGDQSPEAEGSREATVPEKFKNANSDIPQRYKDFSSSQLRVDLSQGVPADWVIRLEP